MTPDGTQWIAISRPCWEDGGVNAAHDWAERAGVQILGDVRVVAPHVKTTTAQGREMKWRTSFYELSFEYAAPLTFMEES